MGCRGVFECEGASLMIHPEICRQRLALVKMPWGLLLWVVWNQFKSWFLGKLFALMPFCPGAQEGLLAQTQLYVSTTLTGFYRVRAGRWGAGETLAAQGQSCSTGSGNAGTGMRTDARVSPGPCASPLPTPHAPASPPIRW